MSEAIARAERRIIDAIESQFDIHAMEPEDWAEMWVAIRRALAELAAQAIPSRRAETTGSVRSKGSAVGNADAPAQGIPIEDQKP
jgi:hypothetical protein